MKPIRFTVMLFKRLLRRPGFLVLLLLIPALTLAYTAGNQEDAGMVTVALAREDAQDSLAQSTMDSLAGSSQLIRFVLCDTPEQAISKVEYGKADCAWVFHKGMAENVQTFLRTRSQKDAFVTIYQREDFVLLTLAKERLNAAVFDAVSRELYLAELIADYAPFADHSRESLLTFWENACIPGQLFTYTQANGGSDPQNHLISPVRGLLGAIVLLGALGCGMYHSRDEEAGTFCYLPHHLSRLPELLGGLCACFALCCAIFVCLLLTDMASPLWHEAICLLGLCLGSTAFSMALRRIFPNIATMAALLPLVMTAALVTSPVFFEVLALNPIGYCMPLSHYLWAAADFSRLPWLFLYSAVCLAIAWIPQKRS